MNDFKRTNKLFSLCGLNCGLCTMNLGGHCPGCGQGSGNQKCTIAHCSMDKDIEYCFECKEFPCIKYKNIDIYMTLLLRIEIKYVILKNFKKLVLKSIMRNN